MGFLYLELISFLMLQPPPVSPKKIWTNNFSFLQQNKLPWFVFIICACGLKGILVFIVVIVVIVIVAMYICCYCGSYDMDMSVFLNTCKPVMAKLWCDSSLMVISLFTVTSSLKKYKASVLVKHYTQEKWRTNLQYVPVKVYFNPVSGIMDFIKHHSNIASNFFLFISSMTRQHILFGRTPQAMLASRPEIWLSGVKDESEKAFICSL